ncbi:hypothetical protein [Paenibacillus thiaminolyticus]|uniref:hypothetical protein n=1 Tax=Paenibacillus thiaminolyticus TaxID=49283 RepID=UPI0011C412FA|nr:hypothetical protein [Paenibacillus thiaminolyticus]
MVAIGVISYYDLMGTGGTVASGFSERSAAGRRHPGLKPRQRAVRGPGACYGGPTDAARR